MCGIVGVFGAPSKKMASVFFDMLQMDVLRGWDSTGVLAVKKKRDWYVHAELGVPQNLLQNPEFSREILDPKAVGTHSLLLGHNRAATKGEVTVQNAHPFIHEPIIGVHNGTLWSYYALEKDYEGHFETDSEAIFWAIREYGPEWVWKRLDGAATLVWWDSAKFRLHFLSNGKRPLYYSHTEDEKNIVFASEPWMIRSACARHNVKLRENKQFYPKDHHMAIARTTRKWKVMIEYQELEPITATPLPNVRAGQYNLPARYDHLRGKVYRNGEWVDKGSSANSRQWPYDDDNVQDNFAARLAKSQEIAARARNNINERRKADSRNYHPASLKYKGARVSEVTGEPLAAKEQLFTDVHMATLQSEGKDKLSEEMFHQIYVHCKECNESLQYEYEESVILDDKWALCQDCAKTSYMHGMNGMRQV